VHTGNHGDFLRFVSEALQGRGEGNGIIRERALGRRGGEAGAGEGLEEGLGRRSIAGVRMVLDVHQFSLER
jgi:hypothetical protein